MALPEITKNVVIVGGGLAGLTSALLLNRAGFAVTLIEKKPYPFHRVCGEYISNEVLPFLKSLDIDIEALGASKITRLAISSSSGDIFGSGLDLGGFGLSRYVLDDFLHQKAKSEGVQFIIGNKVNAINYLGDNFEITLSDNSTLYSPIVIAAYGKRSNLDKERKFFKNRSPYMGVKYHIKTDFPDDLVQLDNFDGGYCGTVKIEGDKYNLCYLSKNLNLKKYGSIEEMERQVLFKNPILKQRFLNADFLNEKPEVINEISFEQKPVVENRILYCGDAAGMISPLCGNGMAMAMHSAKVLSEIIIDHYSDRETVEIVYRISWKNLFENRLITGRLTQRLFGHNMLSKYVVKGLKSIPGLSQYMIRKTHGNPF
ncbi:MAG: NAD(P)/FAD-dependent oxidoreductase [Pyrinomonadaceae bacterium]|nr:NAD(P)/FAD-dependent oxidoreductase [Sphingobacteriaceae bacterium]